MASRRATAAPGEPQYAAGVSQATPESFNLSEENHRLLDADFDAFFDLPADTLESLLQPVRDEFREVIEVPTTPAPGSAPTPIPIPTVSAPAKYSPEASGTWSQPENAALLGMGSGDLSDFPNFFTKFVPAPIDNGRGRGGSAGLNVKFNSNGLDTTLSEPFNFLGEDGFDFQNSGFLPAANNLDIQASLQPVQGLQSNGGGVMTNLHGSEQNAYNGSSTAPDPYGFIQNGQNGFSVGPQNYGGGQNIRNEAPTLPQNYNVGYQVKNEVSPHANDFVFVQNDRNDISAQPRNNFDQVANVSGYGTQAVPYTFLDSEHASQATPHSEGSNVFDYVHVEEAGPVNPVRPGNPPPHADNLGQPGMDAIYQQFMNSQCFQRSGPAPTIPAPASVSAPRRNPASASVPAPRRNRAPASVPASRRNTASAPVSASADFLPTTMAAPALPAATAYTVPPPVVATNTSTGTTAPPVPAPMLSNANNVLLTAQTYIPLINDRILPLNPNGPRPIYPAFSNHFTTGEAAKRYRKRSRGMVKNQAPDVSRVKQFGRKSTLHPGPLLLSPLPHAEV